MLQNSAPGATLTLTLTLLLILTLTLILTQTLVFLTSQPRSNVGTAVLTTVRDRSLRRSVVQVDRDVCTGRATKASLPMWRRLQR